MAMVRVAAKLLRVLLALAALHSLCVLADVATLPDIDINTLLDDEDLSIYEKRASVQLAVDLQSNVRYSDCLERSYLEVVKNQTKSRLLHDIDTECRCLQNRNDIISEEKIECEAPNLLKYSCEIPDWSSTTFDLQKLSQFLNTWSAVILVDGQDVNFQTINDFKFSFNVTGTQVIVVTTEDAEGASGAGANGDLNDLGSGVGQEEVGTVNSIVDENEMGGVEIEVIPAGLGGTSGGEVLRGNVVALAMLSVALAAVLSCVMW